MNTTAPRLQPQPMPQPASLAILIGCLVTCLIAAALGSLFTTASIDGWYAGLSKPVFNPPNWVFAPVWTVLFILMAIALWRAWLHGQGYRRRDAVAAFAVQLMLNVTWSAAFFTAHAPGLALLVIVALIVAILVTMVTFARVDRLAARLMAPYLAWVLFASVLNLSIWILN